MASIWRKGCEGKTSTERIVRGCAIARVRRVNDGANST